ncbi:MAG: ATP-binding protein, partial [Thermoguttaceae bacterium]|nr:ATP-binding protein [Thermoguttaceae bacterium]
RQVLLSRGAYEEVQRLRGRVTYRELMADTAYMERFTSACFLPHTDPSRFPSVAARLQGGGPPRLASVRPAVRERSA